MKVFTTGQCAKILRISPNTVGKLFDSGRLKGYRIPGAQDRRIPLEYLGRFIMENKFPIEYLGRVSNKDETSLKLLVEYLNERGDSLESLIESLSESKTSLESLIAALQEQLNTSGDLEKESKTNPAD